MGTASFDSSVTRRRLFALGGGAIAGVALGRVSRAAASPRNGGTFRIAISDPRNFDPHLTAGWMTQIALSFTHSRLLKHRAGPDVRPGTFAIEGDLAESWTQTGEVGYAFKLRRGVRWHPKPPVNGRELTAEDVKYTYERFLTIKGNPGRVLLEPIDRIEAADRYTVRFALKEPYAWFLDALAGTAAWIVPREAVEAHGDLKRAESCVGTGPWMLERYEPNVRASWVRHPHYFAPGLPHADAIEGFVVADPTARLARWLGGQLDFAPEYGMTVRRLDLDTVRARKPGLQTAEYTSMTGSYVAMKLDGEPFRDPRVRRALALAADRRAAIEASATSMGQGAANPAVPAALVEWSIPLDQLTADGRKLQEYDPAAARRLLGEAGATNGFQVPMETANFGPDWMDAAQIYQRSWKEVGILAELKLKEIGAFLANTMLGKFDKLMLAQRGGPLFPDPYLTAFHLPGELANSSGVSDPRLTEMIRRQRRIFDPARRRDALWDIQRYLAEHVYYVYGYSGRAISAWEPYVKNFGPNLGNDYGGRLVAAWLDR